MAGAVQQRAGRGDAGPPLRPRAGDDSGKSGGSGSGSGSGSDAQGGDSNSGGDGSGAGAPGTAPGGGGGGASTEGDYVDVDGGDYDDDMMVDLAGLQQHGMHHHTSSGTVGVPDTYGANSGAGSRALPASAIVLLRTWMLSHEHFSHPYPSDAEKEELALACGISVRQVREGQGRPTAPQPLLPPCLLPQQVSVWFTNARKRIWVPLRARAARGERISLVIAGRLGCPPPSSLVPYPPHAMPLVAAQSRVQHAPPFLVRQAAPLLARAPTAVPPLAAAHAAPPAQPSGASSIVSSAGAAAEAEARGRRAEGAGDSSGGSARRDGGDMRGGAAEIAMQCDDGGGDTAAAPAGYKTPLEVQRQQRGSAGPPAAAAVAHDSAVDADAAAPAQPVPLVFPFPAATATPSYVMSLLQGVDAPTALSRIGAVERAIAAARADLQVGVGRVGAAARCACSSVHATCILVPSVQAKLAVLDENAAGVEEAQRRLAPRFEPTLQQPQQHAQLASPPAPAPTRLRTGRAADADMQGDAPQLMLPEGQAQQQRQRLHILHGEDEALSPDADCGSIIKMPG